MSAPSPAATAGKIIYAAGQVAVSGANGTPRAVSKGDPVASGDTIATGRGRAQMRFADGGLVSLQPETKFRIDDYQYAGVEDGSERSFFSLVKGGLRAITGAIGHANRKAFKLSTPVATIGIRGSTIAASCGDGCHFSGEGIYAENSTGKYDIDPAYGAIYFKDKNSEGQREEPPVDLTNTESFGSPNYLAGDQRDGSGNQLFVVLPTPEPEPEPPAPPPLTEGPFVGVLIDPAAGQRHAVDMMTDANGPTRISQNFYNGGENRHDDNAITNLTTTRMDAFSNEDFFIQRWTAGDFEDLVGGEPTGESATVSLVDNQSLYLAGGTQPVDIPEADGCCLAAIYDLVANLPSTSLSGATIGEGVIDGRLELDLFHGTSVWLGMTVRHAGTDFTIYGSSEIATLPGNSMRSLAFGNVHAEGSFDAYLGDESSVPAFVDGAFFGSVTASESNGGGSNDNGSSAGAGFETVTALNGISAPRVFTVPSAAALTYKIMVPDPIQGAAGFGFNSIRDVD